MNKWLLEKLMNYLVGKDVFGQIKNLVSDVALNQSLSGSEKKTKVLESLKGIGSDLANHLVNLAVEAAVTLMKEKVK
jgi:hypothetical protein